jgi:hypothetical protein
MDDEQCPDADCFAVLIFCAPELRRLSCRRLETHRFRGSTRVRTTFGFPSTRPAPDTWAMNRKKSVVDRHHRSHDIANFPRHNQI